MKQTFSPSKSQLDRYEEIKKLNIDLTEKTLKYKYERVVRAGSDAFDKWLDNLYEQFETSRGFLELCKSMEKRDD